MADIFACIATRKEHAWDYAGSYGKAGFDVAKLLTDDRQRVVQFLAKYWAWNETEKVYGDCDYNLSVYWGDIVLCDEDGQTQTWLDVDYDSDEFWDVREEADTLWAELERDARALTDQLVAEHTAKAAAAEQLRVEQERAAAKREREREYRRLQLEFGTNAT
jgi:hypothetical protein